MINADIMVTAIDALAFTFITSEVVSKDSWEAISLFIVRVIRNHTGVIASIFIALLVITVSGIITAIYGKVPPANILLPILPGSLSGMVATGMLLVANHIEDEVKRHVVARRLAVLGVVLFFVARAVSVLHSNEARLGVLARR